MDRERKEEFGGGGWQGKAATYRGYLSPLLLVLLVDKKKSD